MKDSTARAEQALEQAIASARVSANKDARLASLAAKTAADAAQLAADALQLAAELRSKRRMTTRRLKSRERWRCQRRVSPPRR